MRFSDLLAETSSALLNNKARSGLTILGIIIGIASVIALVSIGQGATASITDSISSLGSNLITVTPGSSQNDGPVMGGAGSATTLTEDDVVALKKSMTTVESISADISSRYQITYKGLNANTSVVGTQPQYADIHNVTVESGSFFSDQDVSGSTKVAVIGPTTSESLFGSDVSPINKTIRINTISFKIIGVTESKGGTTLSSSDDIIYIPLTAAQRYLTGSQASLSSISIMATSEDAISLAEEEITSILLFEHGISDADSADFQVTSQSDVSESLTATSNTLTILLGSIAGIALLVGGIGIMNMMLTTVTERTREIGLRKAVGATRSSIGIQFLTESVLLTCIGGITGILLGVLAAYIVSQVGLTTTKVTWWSIILAFGVSTVIGIVFGYYPAMRAARLKPIDALKYE